tara:strand:- start:202 stop:492 length:291 start_codon:yes stop_codon:yes gene_type:complete
MIRAIGNKRLYLTDNEFKYYQEIITVIDKTEFSSIFETDNNGNITSVCPNPQKPVSLISIFFLMNVMFNQKLRSINFLIDKVNSLEKRIDNIEVKK